VSINNGGFLKDPRLRSRFIDFLGSRRKQARNLPGVDYNRPYQTTNAAQGRSPYAQRTNYNLGQQLQQQVRDRANEQGGIGVPSRPAQYATQAPVASTGLQAPVNTYNPYTRTELPAPAPTKLAPQPVPNIDDRTRYQDAGPQLQSLSLQQDLMPTRMPAQMPTRMPPQQDRQPQASDRAYAQANLRSRLNRPIASTGIQAPTNTYNPYTRQDMGQGRQTKPRGY
jgi:hypothetical protein